MSNYTIGKGTIPKQAWEALLDLGLDEMQAYRAWQIISAAQCSDPEKMFYLVGFNLPEGATAEEGQSYVEDAITSWCGSLNPGMDGAGHPDDDEADPMFYLDRNSIVIRHLPSKE